MDGCRPPTGYKNGHESMALLMVSQPFDIIHVVLCVQNFFANFAVWRKVRREGDVVGIAVGMAAPRGPGHHREGEGPNHR